MKYKCEKCGQVHTGLSALAFRSPYYYSVLSEAEQKEVLLKTDDFCVIEYDDQVDYFIRVVLLQKMEDACENLEYGVWVSVSANSFEDYYDNYESEDYQEGYFGFLANSIPEYEDTLSIRMNVYTQKNGNRPFIEVQGDEDLNHPFVKDYFNGISLNEAKERIENMMRNLK